MPLNIIIFLLNSPPHFLSPIPHYLVCFPHYLPDVCLIRGSFVECVTQVFELVYLFYFPSFPFPLILFTLPLSLVEHHRFRLFNIHFQLFFLTYFPRLFIIFLISLLLFATITKSSANARLQIFSLPTILPPPLCFL
jgi:hypothetical protein